MPRAERSIFFPTETDDPRLRTLLTWSDDYFFGFRFEDAAYAIRAFLAVAMDEEILKLDLEQLVAEGCIDDDEELWVRPQSLIVLTEGSSDSRALRDSLQLLYPRLARYIHFIDFELAKTDGGTSHLVRFARMFIGCAIRNRIVVLFDNDGAGHEALRELERGGTPSNMFAIPLPDLDLARAYPTFGPQGASVSDVNGRACSIEMYFGRDCLRETDGNLASVQWKDFKKNVARYHGEITDKLGVTEVRGEAPGRVTRCGRGSQSRLLGHPFDLRGDIHRRWCTMTARKCELAPVALTSPGRPTPLHQAPESVIYSRCEPPLCTITRGIDNRQ